MNLTYIYHLIYPRLLFLIVSLRLFVSAMTFVFSSSYIVLLIFFLDDMPFLSVTQSPPHIHANFNLCLLPSSSTHISLLLSVDRCFSPVWSYSLSVPKKHLEDYSNYKLVDLLAQDYY